MVAWLWNLPCCARLLTAAGLPAVASTVHCSTSLPHPMPVCRLLPPVQVPVRGGVLALSALTAVGLTKLALSGAPAHFLFEWIASHCVSPLSWELLAAVGLTKLVLSGGVGILGIRLICNCPAYLCSLLSCFLIRTAPMQHDWLAGRCAKAVVMPLRAPLQAPASAAR